MPRGKFKFPNVFTSKTITLGQTMTSIYVTLFFTGDIQLYVSADAGVNWDRVTSLISGVRKIHTFENSGTDLKYIIVGNPGARVYTPFNSFGEYLAPGVKIET